MKYSGIKKTLALVLALVMCASALSAGALASEEASAMSLPDEGLALWVEEEAAADAAAEEIAISHTTFPDESFRNYILGEVDTDTSGSLSPEEIAAVIALDCSGCYIGDLTGLEYFTSLRYLYCSDNDLTKLDVGGLGALRVLDCSGNGLRSLEVSGCDKLEELWVQGNALTELDLTNNPYLEDCLSISYLMEQNGVDCWSGPDGTPLKNDSGVKIALAGGILLNSGSIPDDNFRLLLRDGIDGDGSGYMPYAEAAEVTELDCLRWDIADFSGLELFPNLTRLDCGGTSAVVLDLRKAPGLEMVYLLGERIDGDGVWIYVYEETDGVLLVDKGVSVRTVNGGADADRDGDTDADDALAALRHAVGTETLTESGLEAAEVTGDGVVDARDAVQILRFFHGLSSMIR